MNDGLELYSSIFSIVLYSYSIRASSIQSSSGSMSMPEKSIMLVSGICCFNPLYGSWPTTNQEVSVTELGFRHVFELLPPDELVYDDSRLSRAFSAFYASTLGVITPDTLAVRQPAYRTWFMDSHR